MGALMYEQGRCEMKGLRWVNLGAGVGSLGEVLT